jgi:hypothetical protein
MHEPHFLSRSCFEVRNFGCVGLGWMFFENVSLEGTSAKKQKEMEK